MYEATYWEFYEYPARCKLGSYMSVARDIQQIYCSAQTGQHEPECCPVWALQHILYNLKYRIPCTLPIKDILNIPLLWEQYCTIAYRSIVLHGK